MRDEWKSILLTSALAAVGSAIATTLVTYVVERYLLTKDQGPVFVVVPVVDRPVPGLPSTTQPTQPVEPAVAGYAALGQDDTHKRDVAIAASAGLVAGYLIAALSCAKS